MGKYAQNLKETVENCMKEGSENLALTGHCRQECQSKALNKLPNEFV